ncbi:Kae1-associated kinase Bud32 [Halobacteriales archaeon SW_7_68_16]|nr:MAG: Kae1-associated kinase Bud32 [Halobacteriales archaeon SW_7_68_16]
MLIVGIEGTAWAASAAVYDTERDAVAIETDAYRPSDGGIHPREAAEHMREALPAVIETTLKRAAEWGLTPDGDDRDHPIDAVAFSRGPGLGPCLRTVGTAARSLAGTLDIPLVGVNHMIAHLEIGRHEAGFTAPICLNASGANAHVLAYRNGRYRTLGETMDTGVGNALDKFARHAGWSHPGGPKIESAARDGSYVDLPYVVKGIDFSFAGLSSAANEAVDDGTPVADVCRGLEETVFAMLTEVTERALALTGRDELVLGGGVGQNDRLRSMLTTMCEERAAEFHAPEARSLRDNAGMIAVLGARMCEAGDTIPIEDSAVDPGFRPDAVPVTWRDDPDVSLGSRADPGRGAEATVELGADRVTKRRVRKAYRHPELDDRLRRERTRAEARLLHEARGLGVPTPVVYDVDPGMGRLVVERVGDADLRDALSSNRVRAVGRYLARLHGGDVVHGDPTVRNVRVWTDRDPGGERPATSIIDFGLGYHSGHVEDHAMDLHVLRGSLAGTADDPGALSAAAEAGYRAAGGDPAVLDRLAAVESRGRYRDGE